MRARVCLAATDRLPHIVAHQLSILDSKEKIPYIGRVFTTPSGVTHYYNFWQDEVHVRGIWRRCTLDECVVE